MVNNRFDSIRRVLAEEIKPYQRQKETLFKNINAKLVIADRAYSINEALSYLNQRNIRPVIPQKRDHLDQRDYE